MRWLRSIRARTLDLALKTASRLRSTAGAYGFLSGAFHSELHAVASGRAEHARSKRGRSFKLRRNIHRLEKGLIMRPRKECFGADYIEDTVVAWIGLHGTAPQDCLEARWGAGVLAAYFASATGDARIERAHARFTARYRETTEPGPAPHAHGSIAPCHVSFEDFLSLTQRRQSVRWFLPETVPRQAIDLALLAAAESPSACNRQPFRLIAFLDPVRATEICAMAPGASGFAHQVPATIVVIGDLSAYEEPRDRHLIYIDSGLAMMSFILALETQGLSSCIINWPDIREIDLAIERKLGLPRHERVVFLIAVGRADPQGIVPCSWKRDIADLRSFA